MHMRLLTNFILVFLLLFVNNSFVLAAPSPEIKESIETIDRIQLVSQQINLLKNRLNQSQQELNDLQQEHDKPFTSTNIDKASKSLLDKAQLDVLVSKSNLDSINIELADVQQSANWLDKNSQEIENQLNVLSIFGLKAATTADVVNVEELRIDLSYQQKLIELEKIRIKYLTDLQSVGNNLLQLKKENYNRLYTILKSRKMLHFKQQQIKDELAFQEQQNLWLRQLNVLYAKLAKVDPAKSRPSYSALERDIFYANENANYAYVQSLIARYRDQIQQMKLGIVKSNSISLLNEIGNQVQRLKKQIDRLDSVLKSRIGVLEKHITYMSPKKNDPSVALYLERLSFLKKGYQNSDTALAKLHKDLKNFRISLDEELKVELSSRQGFPTFDVKTLLDLGKEMLLIPALTFQVIKSLSTNLLKAFQSTSFSVWSLLLIGETLLIAAFLFLYKRLTSILKRAGAWREQLNTKWLSLECLRRNFLDLALISNAIAIFLIFKIPSQNFMFIVYLSIVWLICKVILTISRLCLVESMHHTEDHDVKLYRRLKWISLIGGSIIALTAFVHQLPMIYELKTLCDRLFLFFLLIVSCISLLSREMILNLILSKMEGRHPYFQKSVRLIGILIPILLLTNSVIGLAGFMNLVMTVSWYEGIFLLVLIGYLILRGLLSDGMEQLSYLTIQYVNNGWLWTEAILKPLDRVLRITLFLVAWAVLFLFYGWDKQ